MYPVSVPWNTIFSPEKTVVGEKILKYVIRNGKGNIKNCRLVCKHWKLGISRCFHAWKKPLFQINLNKTNSIHGTPYVLNNGKLLDSFVHSATKMLRLEGYLPFFKMTVLEGFFQKENNQSFRDCLSKCGNGLVELNIAFPQDGGSMTFIFPHLSFPNLVHLNVRFTYRGFTRYENMVGSFGTNYNATYLLQQILSGCEKLTDFIVVSIMENNLPYGFSCLEIPNTVTKLDLTCYMESVDLEIFRNNFFPNLTLLELLISDVPFDIGLIPKILEKLSTLQELYFVGVPYVNNPREVTYFRLPEMSNLEKFATSSIHLELEPASSEIEKNVPKLEGLALNAQTVLMFSKWMDHSKFSTVTSLAVTLVNDNFPIGARGYSVGFSLEMMQKVNVALPCLYTLELEVFGRDVDAIRYAFQHMKRLQTLRIDAGRTDDILNSDFWDALFIGIPLEWAASLRLVPEFWEDINFDAKILPSIRNLSDLRELCLHTLCNLSLAADIDTPLISNAAFSFAFLKMNKLRHLDFTGRFKVSPVTVQEWRSSGRTLCDTDSEDQ